MASKTGIAWCDSTLNFWIGCTKVLDQNGKLTDSGCKNCYAETQDKMRFSRNLGGGTKANPITHWGKGVPRYKVAGAVKDALAFNRKPWICNFCGAAQSHEMLGNCDNPECHGNAESIMASKHRRRIFSLSLGDMGDAEVPFDWFRESWATIEQCQGVVWIICTKRCENFLARWKEYCWVTRRQNEDLPSNVIMLTSVENQEAADKRIPALLQIPAACRGLSLEPLLGPVQIYPEWIGNYRQPQLDWLICGGESGPNARPCNVDWIRSLVEQGKAAGVATFVKQLGADPIENDGLPLMRDASIKFDKKGADIEEFPNDLRVRQFPKF